MLDHNRLPELKNRIRYETEASAFLLDAVTDEVRSLQTAARAIQPQVTHAISVAASDAGNNKIEFNPLQLQLVRVVDTANKEHFFDVVSSQTDTTELGKRQFDATENPITPLGRLMSDLTVRTLHELTTMIPAHPTSAGWTLVYRDLCEWAVIYEQCHKDIVTDTLLLHDGLLRTKIFAKDYFVQMYRRIKAAIDKTKREDKRSLYLVGMAKHTEVLARYRLALEIANVFPSGPAKYVPVPMDMQQKVYKWAEYLRLPTDTDNDLEQPKYNMGEMYFVRFGTHAGDPVWTVDLMSGQTGEAQQIFGALLNDAIEGFPVPFYPLSLQEADAHAQIVDFDLAILQDEMIEAIRSHLTEDERPIFDAHRLITADPAARRYS